MGRKIVCLLMTLVLVLGLAACGDMSGNEPNSMPVFSEAENEEVLTTVTTEDENESAAAPTTTTTTEAEEEETTKRTTTTTKKKTTAKTTKKTTKATTKKATTTKATTAKKTTTTKEFVTTTTKAPTTITTTTTTTTTKKPTTAPTTAPQAKIYGAGQTWKVPGQFEFTINSVQQHYICGIKRDDDLVTSIIIDYTWKNLGYDTKLQFGIGNFDVYDEKGEESYWTVLECNHDKTPGNVLVGGTASAQLTVPLYNDNNRYVTIFVGIGFGDYSATFKIPVTEAPPEPEEDKLEGCTITVDNDLPETFSYSNSYPEKYTSSCSVTEVTFEVSGEDLYMYFSGRKTYDSRGSGQSDQCAISWKLYDDDTNTVIATGTAYTLSLAEGEGFVKTEDEAYDCITPGGNYRLLLLNTN